MKVLAIVGPTRTGKTELALRLAHKFGSEIISADSRQVYQGMDIGTGKGKKRKMTKKKGKWIVRNIPLYLYDVVKPNEQFSVARYCNLVNEILEDLSQRKKLPILVGGTGFYIKAILDVIDTLGISPDWELRSQLENLSTLELYKKLIRIDPKKAKNLNSSDRKNPRRLVRAIEIALTILNAKGKVQKLKTKKHLMINSLIIGITANRDVLYQKADGWVEEILEGGLINETRVLLKKGYKNAIPTQGIIYKSTVDYLSGKFTLAKLKEKLKGEMHDYIRRQLVWFKKDKRIIWFDIQKEDYQKKIENLVQTWLNG